MKIPESSWKRRGINEKFGLIFILLLAIVLFTGVSSYLSFLHINRLNNRILQSNNIVQHVLDMDRGMEKARRLHGDFFLHYQRIGLRQAHEFYAQPSIREIARVISLSTSLEDLLVEEDRIALEEVQQTEINLYLALAKRFADTSIESIELISLRSAPGRGLESQLMQAEETIRKLLENQPELLSLILEAQSYYKDYLIHRKRHFMQSALNLLHTAVISVEMIPPLSAQAKTSIAESIRHMEILATQLLEIDLAITAKFNDFSLQAQTAAPISKSLVEQSRQGVAGMEKQIKKAYLTTGLAVLISIILAVLVILMIARLVYTNITQNVLALTKAAKTFSNGQFGVRVEKRSNDELGQLACSFNYMAGKITDLIDNLEIKVVQRTRELSLSEERFRTLINELPQIAVQGFNEQRDIVYWNQASQKLFGYPESAALGRKIEELICPEELYEQLRRSIHIWLVDEILPEPAEQLLIDKDGTEKPVYSAYAMQIGNRGNRTMYCIHIDLAELKRAEAKGRISETFYRQLFEHSSSGVAVFEVQGDGENFIFKDFNTAAENIERIDRNLVISRPITEVFPGAEAFGLIDVLKQVWKTGNPMDLPESYYEDERVQGWREIKVYKVPTGEIVAVYNDITSRKIMEEDRSAMELRLQRARKMEAIGLMAGGIAHDLNNILSAIVGYPELLLLQLPEKSELRRPIEAMREAGERAATIVADLLTVARGVASARNCSDINTLVEEYLQSPEFRHLQQLHPRVRFKSDLEKNLPAIECSPVHVKKCLMNLAANGAEAIEKNGEISFITRLLEPDDRLLAEYDLNGVSYVTLSVIDNGGGIHPDDLERIFEPFYTKKVMGKRNGTGLGLSVVWNTMKEHGGTVRACSTGSGSCFDLCFPASGCEPVPQEKPAAVLQRGRGECILVVDDEPQQCDLAKSMLEHLGYSVACVSSGREAIVFLEKNDVDLILLDMLMDPGINGRETYRWIQEIKPAQRAVIASGFCESDDVQATLRMGAGSFIKKPYSMQELAGAVDDVLKKDIP